MGVVELITSDGDKVIIADPDDREAVLNIALNHIK